jgi:hypothetical protein
MRSPARRRSDRCQLASLAGAGRYLERGLGYINTDQHDERFGPSTSPKMEYPRLGPALLMRALRSRQLFGLWRGEGDDLG